MNTCIQQICSVVFSPIAPLKNHIPNFGKKELDVFIFINGLTLALLQPSEMFPNSCPLNRFITTINFNNSLSRINRCRATYIIKGQWYRELIAI